MITPLVLVVALTSGSALNYDLIGPPGPTPAVVTPTLAPPKPAPVKPAPAPKKQKWPPVCLHVLGFKGCVPCEEMKKEKVLEQMEEEGHKVFYWDIDKRKHLPKGFGVKYGYPHFTMAIDGIITEQHDGKLNSCALRHWFEHIEAVRAGESKLDPSVRYTKGTELPHVDPKKRKQYK